MVDKIWETKGTHKYTHKAKAVSAKSKLSNMHNVHAYTKPQAMNDTHTRVIRTNWSGYLKNMTDLESNESTILNTSSR